MKQNKKNHASNVRYVHRKTYPNATDAGYFAGKLLQVLTAILSGMGFVGTMVLLVSFT